jgi:hypothetical protein
MVLKIELSPDLERRLAEEAARRGQAEEEFARTVLEERLAPPGEPDRRGERTATQILDDFFVQFPRSVPAELAELARQQGVTPLPGVEHLLVEGPEGAEEFDVDAFLAARKRWQWEGRLPGTGLAEPEDARQ